MVSTRSAHRQHLCLLCSPPRRPIHIMIDVTGFRMGHLWDIFAGGRVGNSGAPPSPLCLSIPADHPFMNVPNRCQTREVPRWIGTHTHTHQKCAYVQAVLGYGVADVGVHAIRETACSALPELPEPAVSANVWCASCRVMCPSGGKSGGERTGAGTVLARHTEVKQRGCRQCSNGGLCSLALLRHQACHSRATDIRWRCEGHGSNF